MTTKTKFVDQEARDMAKSVAAGLVSHERVCDELNKSLAEWKQEIRRDIAEGFKAIQRTYEIGQGDMTTRFENSRTVDNDRHTNTSLGLAENIKDTFTTVMENTTKLHATAVEISTKLFAEVSSTLSKTIEAQNAINILLSARQDRTSNWLIGSLLTLSGSLSLILIGMIVREMFVKGLHP